MPQEEISQFKLISTVEGISFLILLFIAMPLKYFFGMPIATKIVGSIHGALFMYYLFLQYKSSAKYNWNFKQNALFFVASIVPFMTFYTHKILAKLETQYKQSQRAK